MKFTLYNYRHAEEIVRDPKFVQAFDEITDVIKSMPLFTYTNKSKKNKRLDIVQQVHNVFFDRCLAADRGWSFHPLATAIESSGLAADYHKSFGDGADRLRIQAEVQFGNMGRWYSDIFKFQAAYASDLIEMGLSVVPMSSISTRIDSNVVNFERVCRELPAAKLSITLPILVFGIEPDRNTQTWNLRDCRFASNKALTGKKVGRQNCFRVVNAFLNGGSAKDVGPDSPIGKVPELAKALPPEVLAEIDAEDGLGDDG